MKVTVALGWEKNKQTNMRPVLLFQAQHFGRGKSRNVKEDTRESWRLFSTTVIMLASGNNVKVAARTCERWARPNRRRLTLLKPTTNSTKSAAGSENTFSGRLFLPAGLLTGACPKGHYFIFRMRSGKVVRVSASFYDIKINWPSLSSFKTKVWPLSCLIIAKMHGFQEVV